MWLTESASSCNNQLIQKQEIDTEGKLNSIYLLKIVTKCKIEFTIISTNL